MPWTFLHKILSSEITIFALKSFAPIQYLEEFNNFYEIVGVCATTGLVFNQMMLRLVSWFVFKRVYIEVFGIYAQDLEEQ